MAASIGCAQGPSTTSGFVRTDGDVGWSCGRTGTDRWARRGTWRRGSSMCWRKVGTARRVRCRASARWWGGDPYELRIYCPAGYDMASVAADGLEVNQNQDGRHL